MRIFLFSLLFLSVFLCSSCNREKPPLSQKEMETVLLELHLTEAYIDREHRSSDSVLKTNVYYSILNKHQLTKSQFDEALTWYAKHPHHYQKLYEALSSRVGMLSTQENERENTDKNSISQNGEKVEIGFEGKELYFNSLSRCPIYKYDFSPDENFEKGDSFCFTCTPFFSKRCEEEYNPLIRMDLRGANGKVFSDTAYLQSGKPVEMSIGLPINVALKQLVLRVYPSFPQSCFSLFFIQEPHLTRIHPLKPSNSEE